MRNRVYVLWIVAALVLLGACAPAVAGNPVDPTATDLSPTAGAGTTAAPPATGLSATLEMPSHLTNGRTVELKFTLTNNTEAGLYVLKWYTPLERFGGEIFCVVRDGKPIPYRGPEAERGDPTPDSYVFVEAGASVSATVDLAAAYDFWEAGEYTIGFSSPRMSHVARTEGEMATSLDDVGPVAMPSNQVPVTILEDL